MNLLAEFAKYLGGLAYDRLPRSWRKDDIPPSMRDPFPTYIAYIAEQMVGLHEEGGPNKGDQLKEIFAADSYDPNGSKPGDDGYPWCAAFVCLVVKKAMEQHGGPFTFKRPTTPSAFGFEDWSLAQDNSTHTKMNPGRDIKRSDLVIYGFSHIGVAATGVDKDGYFEAVEGNTNLAGSREGTHVLRKRRHISSVRSRIRFT